jgi:cytochrome c2
MKQHLMVIGAMLFTACLTGSFVRAQNTDVVEGEKLYLKECGVCHGNISSSQSEYRLSPPSRRVRMVLASFANSTLLDIAGPLHGLRWVTNKPADGQAAEPATRLAMAPPFGPNLRGVYGRLAGTVPGFTYSRAFRKVLHGMVWNSSSLDVWLTDTQAWVPGVRMYYKQPNPEIRRKIILYLQANP